MIAAFFTKFKDYVMDKLAAKLVAALVAILVSGLAGFGLSRAQEKDSMKAQVKAEVLEEIKTPMDSCTSKLAQVLFLLDQVVTPEQKARAADNFQRAKANLGLK